LVGIGADIYLALYGEFKLKLEIDIGLDFWLRNCSFGKNQLLNLANHLIKWLTKFSAFVLKVLSTISVDNSVIICEI